MKSFIFKFDPKEKGLRQVLGDLEYDIMEIIWENKEVSVRTVHDILKKKRNLAYTTVMTVMSRLADKGILERIKEGSAYSYKAVLNKENFIKSSVKQVLGNLLNDFTSPVISQFVELLDEENPEKIEELARLIEKKRGKKNV